MENQIETALETLTWHLSGGPNNVCIVNSTGEIEWVNEHWKKFAIENQASDEISAGWNYLNTSEDAFGPCSEFARTIAASLRGLISGRRLNVFACYPCHSLTEHRWFALNAFQIASETKELAGRIAIIHTNISGMIDPAILVSNDVPILELRH